MKEAQSGGSGTIAYAADHGPAIAPGLKLELIALHFLKCMSF
jgi:hypothetical protein